MYSDYDIVYKSNINQFFIFWIVLGVIGLVLILLTLFSLSKVFKKANMSGIAAWIPIYNIMILVEIANLPKIYVLLMLIPFVNLYFYFKLCATITKMFKKKDTFVFGLFFFPFIFYPILAFSDSEYIGINLVAMEGKTTVHDIPVIDDNKNKEIEIEVNDQEDVASRNINISIGGGVYQKDYANSLDSVSKDNMVNIAPKPPVQEKEVITREPTFINNSTIEEIAKIESADKEVKEEVQKVDLFDIPVIQMAESAPQPQPIETQPQVQPETQSVEKAPEEKKTMALKPILSENGEYSVCPNCGTRVGENSKMCFICGQPLE